MRYNMSVILVIHLISILLACNREVKTNCNDIHALNYEKNSLTDTDCTYQNIQKAPTLIAHLPSKLKETSGLASFNNSLITHNDKGNTNELFFINTSDGSIVKTIKVENASNVDWEDLAQSSTHLFIGDMGNNDGNRKDLKIYILPFSEFSDSTKLSVTTSGTIRFTYPNQSTFDSNKDHNFDCEAILYYKENLYLFTKNRLDSRTNLYRIPAKAGEYVASFIHSFEVGGRITGADINETTNEIALIGYNKSSECFIWLLSDFTNDNFFSAKKKQIKLGSYASLGQMEAICYKSASSLWITSEKTGSLAPSLYEISLQ
jgi:hypothetical protein